MDTLYSGQFVLTNLHTRNSVVIFFVIRRNFLRSVHLKTIRFKSLIKQIHIGWFQYPMSVCVFNSLRVSSGFLFDM